MSDKMKPGIYTNTHWSGHVSRVLNNGRVMRIDGGLDPTGLAPDHWQPSSIVDIVWFWRLTFRYLIRHLVGYVDYHTVSKELGIVGREMVVNNFYERYNPLTDIVNMLNLGNRIWTWKS